MSYETQQAGLLAVIQTVSGYSTTNTSLSDYRILQKGVTKCVVLRPSAFTRERLDFVGTRQNTWNVAVELFVKYQDDAQVNNSIRDERQNIIDKVDQYPKLNATAGCFHAMITGGKEPTPVFGEDGSGPHYMLAEMTCQIIEHANVTEAE